MNKLFARIVAGMLLVFSLNVAWADPVYLACTGSVDKGLSLSVALDYAAATVSVTQLLTATLVTDLQNRTAMPIQVSDSRVTWVSGYTAAGGVQVHVSWTLNRLTGTLAAYNDNVRDGDSYSCKLGEKPTPKF